MTYREIIYIVNDLCKQFSDDTNLTEDHILFLLNKYRGTLLNQYSKQKMLVPHENYQTIQVQCNITDTQGAQYKSTNKVPNLLSIGNPLAYTSWFGLENNINLISRERMRYVGYSKLINELYCSIAPDHYVYVKVPIKKQNNETETLEVYITGVFEDAIAAYHLEGSSVDLYDATFPIDSSLMPNLLQAVLKDILGASYRPADNSNNAKDDLADLAYFIQKNVKSALAKQLDTDA